MLQVPFSKFWKEINGSVERIRICPSISLHETFYTLGLIPALGINGVAM
jgi:hypothetical protein